LYVSAELFKRTYCPAEEYKYKLDLAPNQYASLFVPFVVFTVAHPQVTGTFCGNSVETMTSAELLNGPVEVLGKFFTVLLALSAYAVRSNAAPKTVTTRKIEKTLAMVEFFVLLILISPYTKSGPPLQVVV
jgi:hypothetical protein